MKILLCFQGSAIVSIGKETLNTFYVAENTETIILGSPCFQGRYVCNLYVKDFLVKKILSVGKNIKIAREFIPYNLFEQYNERVEIIGELPRFDFVVIIIII